MWNLPISYVIAATLGGVACASSVWLLALMLDSHNLNGTWHKGWGLPMLAYGDVAAAIYLKVSLSDFLTLFAARTVGPFWSQAPAGALLAAAVFATGCSTILASVWPFNEPKDTVIDGLATGSPGERRSRSTTIGVVWLYVFAWWMLQDGAKLGLYACLRRAGLLHPKYAITALEVQAAVQSEEARKKAAGGGDDGDDGSGGAAAAAAAGQQKSSRRSAEPRGGGSIS